MSDNISQIAGIQIFGSPSPASGDEPTRGTRGKATGRFQNVDGTRRMVYERGSTILGCRSQDIFLLLTQIGSGAGEVRPGHGCVGECRSIERALRAGTEPDI